MQPFFSFCEYSAVLLAVIVEKSKKCLDFAVTLFMLHFILCALYDGTAVLHSLDFWIVHVFGMIIMVLFGEFLCSRRELMDIPLLWWHGMVYNYFWSSEELTMALVCTFGVQWTSLAWWNHWFVQEKTCSKWKWNFDDSLFQKLYWFWFLCAFMNEVQMKDEIICFDVCTIHPSLDHKCHEACKHYWNSSYSEQLKIIMPLNFLHILLHVFIHSFMK